MPTNTIDNPVSNGRLSTRTGVYENVFQKPEKPKFTHKTKTGVYKEQDDADEDIVAGNHLVPERSIQKSTKVKMSSGESTRIRSQLSKSIIAATNGLREALNTSAFGVKLSMLKRALAICHKKLSRMGEDSFLRLVAFVEGSISQHTYKTIGKSELEQVSKAFLLSYKTVDFTIDALNKAKSFFVSTDLSPLPVIDFSDDDENDQCSG